LPRSLSEYEAEVQARIKKAFSRGRITVQVQLDESAEASLPIAIDEDAVRAYTGLLNRLRAVAGISEPIRLEHLLQYSDIFEASNSNSDRAEAAWEATTIALDQAIDEMRRMRRQEGTALLTDLEDRIRTIERLVDDVERRAPLRVEEARERLRSRLEDLLSDDRIDRARLETEVAILADRLDITEECVRLRSHLEMFRQALNSEHPEGRKLNFISQEINREVNTIGSKSNDAEIAHLAVQMKDELEKIREQVQNVE